MTTAIAELPSDALASLPILISITSAPAASPRQCHRLTDLLLQTSHRAGTVALLAVLATVALAFTGRDFYVPLAAAAGCADLGLCAAVLCLSFTRRGQPRRREAAGVGVLNGVLAGLCLLLITVARAGVIQEGLSQTGSAVRAGAQDFFTPPPALPPQQ